ncbi:MAG: hypothetical protein HOF74_06970 [Gammaproteobacteria bacterium]|jgi:hypothetical protein|nr:hypothetical protein [Gammaproteobacteria bacterium]MBT3859553.1 hypothetical protein [Gammaproteobacteria bacterium]MBT3986553.1 hypothetical protein [Gammaproteobacteria bacterium]MBT4254759.1 hypothetical protein [Gammaproteobacteria bacterium]MBT4581103.1 hypothetical protein [Gammaproteobacteria bacterium]
MTKLSFTAVVVDVLFSRVVSTVVKTIVVTFDGSVMHSAGDSFAEFIPQIIGRATYLRDVFARINPNTNLQSLFIPSSLSHMTQRCG